MLSSKLVSALCKVCMLQKKGTLMDKLLQGACKASDGTRAPAQFVSFSCTASTYASSEVGLQPLCLEVLPFDDPMAGAQAWRKSKEWVTVSQLQKAIHRGLREAGLDVQMEYNEGLFSVDLALFLPPSHPGGDKRKARTSIVRVELNSPASAGLAQASASACLRTGVKLLSAKDLYSGYNDCTEVSCGFCRWLLSVMGSATTPATAPL